MSPERTTTNPAMPTNGVVFLMYHELEIPGRPLCQTEAGYSRYVVQEANFRSQVKWLQEAGWRSLSVSEALASERNINAVAVTFDDGCESDLLSAAPILSGAGYHATFYVTVGYLGRRGYLTPAQLRELGALG